MTLSILDQSPVVTGTSYKKAIDQTLTLAKEAEKLGYHRFWVSEHHNTKSFASASPEILLTRIASLTNNIRVGSGGVLLTHYSPLKVAEQFCMLENLFPGRIDLGIGRAGGGDAFTNRSLNPNMLDDDQTLNKFNELISYLEQTTTLNKRVKAVPQINSIPKLWVLGTSPASALYAAERGLPYSFGSFINDEQCISSMQMYHQKFTPSKHLAKPYVNHAVYVICAETNDDAVRISRSSELWFIKTFIRNEDVPFPKYEETQSTVYSPQEEMALDFRRKGTIIGNVDKVKSDLEKLSEKLAVDEFTIVTITDRFEDRLTSYRLLARAFNLHKE
ncbi:MAG: LLM class flavin-dependent oxidoreductase [Ignavibacteria bacterium]|nr:MAG: LLM class flavin-dependent oxidoreductase [Ignavibacteria bacterium]